MTRNVMVENKRLFTSLLISLLVHAVLIYFIPFLARDKPEEKIGSYTRVQLIQPSYAPARKAGPKTQPPRDAPAPDMDPTVRDRMNTVQDIPMPSFSVPWSQRQRQKPDPLSQPQEMPLEDEVMAQEEQPIPTPTTPQPVDIATARRQPDLPRPVPDALDFDQEKFPQEVIEKDMPPDAAEIEWQGNKARRILSKPDRPARYPDGYQGQVQGRIRLKFWVDTQGYVVKVVPMQKLDPRLDVVATDYLRQYRFEPVSEGKKSELQWGIIPFSFRLE